MLLAVVCTKGKTRGKIYLTADDAGAAGYIDESAVTQRIDALAKETGISPPDEPLPENNMRAFTPWAYGLTRWGDLFTPRQLLSMLTFTKHIRKAHTEMIALGYDGDRARAVASVLTCVLDRLADFSSTLCLFKASGGRGVVHTFGRSALPMTWDFAETNPFNLKASSWPVLVKDVAAALVKVGTGRSVNVVRGSATELPYEENFFDAIVTDPPYYDNVPYADLSDFFYVWARRAIGDLYREHFATPLTPKRREAIAEPARHGGDKKGARRAYETMMARAFAEMNRVLKPGAPLCPARL